MRNRILFSVMPLFFCLCVANSVTAADILDDIATAFKNSDVTFLSKNFTSEVELDILNQDEVYTVNQAELILKDFFFKNKPLISKVLHKVTSNPDYRFAVIILQTNKGTYRISYELKSFKGKFLITQIRIEPNKE